MLKPGMKSSEFVMALVASLLSAGAGVSAQYLESDSLALKILGLLVGISGPIMAMFKYESGRRALKGAELEVASAAKSAFSVAVDKASSKVDELAEKVLDR